MVEHVREIGHLTMNIEATQDDLDAVERELAVLPDLWGDRCEVRLTLMVASALAALGELQRRRGMTSSATAETN